MESIDGKLTQQELDELRHELARLEMEQQIGIDNKEEIKEIKAKLKGLL